VGPDPRQTRRGAEKPTVRGFIQDITEQKERERRLRVQNERLDSFASVVSHDLQGPLTVAQGHLELAQQDVANDHLDSIDAAHERMQTLIDDILTLAREGREATTTEPVTLQTAATACWETIETESAALETDTDSVVLADPGRLQRLLSNLFRNCVAQGQNLRPLRCSKTAWSMARWGSRDSPTRLSRTAAG